MKISHSTICDYLNDRRLPSRKGLAALAAGLGVDRATWSRFVDLWIAAWHEELLSATPRAAATGRTAPGPPRA